VAVFVIAAIFAPWIEPHDPQAQDIARRLKPPGYFDVKAGASFWLGTDGLAATSSAADRRRARLATGRSGRREPVGAARHLAGIDPGYAGGWWDSIIMRVVDVWQAIPFTILAIAVAVILGPACAT